MTISATDITEDDIPAWPTISQNGNKEFSMGTGMETKDSIFGGHVEIKPYRDYSKSTWDDVRKVVVWNYRVHPKQIWWTQAYGHDCSLLVPWDGVGPWWDALKGLDPDYKTLYAYCDMDMHIGSLTFELEEDQDSICDSLAWYSEQYGDADYKYDEYLFCRQLIDLYMGISGSNRIVDEGWITMREGPFVTAVSKELMKETMEQQKELNARGLFDAHPPYRIG